MKKLPTASLISFCRIIMSKFCLFVSKVYICVCVCVCEPRDKEKPTWGLHGVYLKVTKGPT
jgi:hypothetical protein